MEFPARNSWLGSLCCREARRCGHMHSLYLRLLVGHCSRSSESRSRISRTLDSIGLSHHSDCNAMLHFGLDSIGNSHHRIFNAMLLLEIIHLCSPFLEDVLVRFLIASLEILECILDVLHHGIATTIHAFKTFWEILQEARISRSCLEANAAIELST